MTSRVNTKMSEVLAILLAHGEVKYPIAAWPKILMDRSSALEMACSYAGITPELAKSDCKTAVIAARRAWVAYLLRARNYSYPQIAHVMGRDHTTILHACRIVNAVLANQAEGRAA